MHQRKIQLIGGSTYSVSLPKEWVLKNSLKEQSIVSIQLKGDNSLSINPQHHPEKIRTSRIELSIDEYGRNIGQVLFSLYYSGFEDIILNSSAEITHEIKLSIQKRINYMSGTEIIYEDAHTIKLKVLLDSRKLNIHQLFFRVALLICSSLDSLENNLSKESLDLNEQEVDRLYHLLAKILSLSSLRPEILTSSQVEHSSHIVPYSLIAKRLENIADNIYKLKEVSCSRYSEILDFIKKTIKNDVSTLIRKEDKVFVKTEKAKRDAIRQKVEQISDLGIKMNLFDILRYIFDIQEEIVNISFYQALQRENLL